ncbi:MAG: hypothetical protein ABI045_00485 [Flavobacteriales bacterium]
METVKFFQGVKTIYSDIQGKFNAVENENLTIPFNVLFTEL